MISGGLVTQYTGTITLTFGAGLPAGNYTFTVNTAGGKIPGLVDAAGNADRAALRRELHAPVSSRSTSRTCRCRTATA